MLCSRFLAENRTTGLVAFARTIRVSEPASSPQKVRTYTKFTGLILVELMKSHRILKLSASKMMRVPVVVTQSVAKMPWDFASSLKSSQVWLWSALRLTMMTSMKMRLDLGILSNDRKFWSITTVSFTASSFSMRIRFSWLSTREPTSDDN